MATIVLMQITTELMPLDQIEIEALIVPVFEGIPDTRFGAEDLFSSGEIVGKALDITLLHHAPGVRATRVPLLPHRLREAILRGRLT